MFLRRGVSAFLPSSQAPAYVDWARVVVSLWHICAPAFFFFPTPIYGTPHAINQFCFDQRRFLAALLPRLPTYSTPWPDVRYRPDARPREAGSLFSLRPPPVSS